MADTVDTVFRNALLIDGTGAKARSVDVAVCGGRVSAIRATLATAAKNDVDCHGMVLAPGFIDVHSHDDLAVLKPHGADPKLWQGVTTVVTGNCGHGCAPTARNSHAAAEYSAPIIGTSPATWRRYADYLAALRENALQVNVAPLIPHGTVRIAVMGFAARKASATEREGISTIIGDALRHGAFGASLGLVYAPGMYADERELTQVATTVAEHNGILAVHLRSEGRYMTDALEEMLSIARTTGVRLQVSHLKCAGTQSHGRMQNIIATLDSARSTGVDVTADAYPYTAGSTTITSMFPSWSIEGGVEALLTRLRRPDQKRQVQHQLGEAWIGQENQLYNIGADGIEIIPDRAAEVTEYGGSLDTLACRLGLTPEEALIEAVLGTGGECAVIQHHGVEKDVIDALHWQHTMVGSDGLPTTAPKPHPRLYGTFPRTLGRYVRELAVLPLEEQIYRMTSLPARRFGIPERGEIEEGAIADLVMLDPRTVQGTATYDNPRAAPIGIHQTLVGGRRASGNEAPARGQLLTNTTAPRDHC